MEGVSEGRLAGEDRLLGVRNEAAEQGSRAGEQGSPKRWESKKESLGNSHETSSGGGSRVWLSWGWILRMMA
jgi:hypothetical protein